VARLLELAWQRPATDDEVQTALQFMEDIQQQDGGTAEKALDLLGLIAINSNEFLYLD